MSVHFPDRGSEIRNASQPPQPPKRSGIEAIFDRVIAFLSRFFFYGPTKVQKEVRSPGSPADVNAQLDKRVSKVFHYIIKTHKKENASSKKEGPISAPSPFLGDPLRDPRLPPIKRKKDL